MLRKWSCNELYTAAANLVREQYRRSRCRMLRKWSCNELHTAAANFVREQYRRSRCSLPKNTLATNSTLLDFYLHNNIGDRRTILRRITSYLKRNNNAIKQNKWALVVVCATSVMSHHQNHGKEEAEVVEDGAEGSVFPDAILNEEEASRWPILPHRCQIWKLRSIVCSFFRTRQWWWWCQYQPGGFEGQDCNGSSCTDWTFIKN